MKFASACLENMRLKPASGEIFDSFGLSGSPDHTRRCWITLPTIAASTSSSSGMATAASTSSADLLHHRKEAAPVDADGVGIGDQPAHGGGQVLAHRAGERHQHQRAAGDDEPGIDLLALGDVAALESVVEALLRRVF